VRPSRGRGQNFLVQPAIADRIVAAADIGSESTAIEIGPGLGILSDRIAASAVAEFTMVELDSALADALARRFSNDPRIRIVNADILSVDLPALTDRRPLTIVGNLPFNAAGAILRRLCEWQPNIGRMVLMFQREVGERIRAHPGERSRGALTLFTDLYWECAEHFRVRAGSFHPRPAVDAEVLVMTPRTPPLFAPGEESLVLETIRAAFSAPRKAVRNALGDRLGIGPAAAAVALERCDIDPMARASTLETGALIVLARTLAASFPEAYAAERPDA
jgi:16S rRNA (adenine1518-N6/adenine1519-N6)-dimethyltransferase